MTVDEVIQEVERMLSKDRFNHTLRVTEIAVKLAEHYNESTNKVKLAALLHDYAKELSHVELKQYITNHQLNKRLLQYNQELWHGPVAAHMVEHQFEINDESVQHAIYYHTTGRAKMDMIELIVFVADYIEPARDLPGIDQVRELAFTNLHEAALLSLKNTIPFLIQKGATIFPDTFHAYNDLTTFVKGDSK